MELPPKFNGFPTRENCNPEDPYQAFLWMLVAFPGQNGGQLILPVDYLQLVSKRLWDCGARPAADPVIKYRKPTGMEPHWMTAPGHWVPVDAPEQDSTPAAERAVAGLIPKQQAEFFRALYDKMTPAQRAELMRETAEDMRRDLGKMSDD